MRTQAVTLLIGIVAGAAFSTGTASAAEVISANGVQRAAHDTGKAARALEAGNLKKARELFERALERLDGYPEAHLGLGHIAMAERRFDDALAQYQLARDGSHRFARLLFDRHRRRYDEATNRLADLRQQRTQLAQRVERTRSGERNRWTPNYQAMLARLDRTVMRLEQIEAPQASSLHEVPPEIEFYIGNALNRRGRFADAVEAWERAARGTRRFPSVNVNLAVAYWKLGRLDEAREQVRVAEKAGAVFNPEFIRDLNAAFAGTNIATSND